MKSCMVLDSKLILFFCMKKLLYFKSVKITENHKKQNKNVFVSFYRHKHKVQMKSITVNVLS